MQATTTSVMRNGIINIKQQVHIIVLVKTHYSSSSVSTGLGVPLGELSYNGVSEDSERKEVETTYPFNVSQTATSFTFLHLSAGHLLLLLRTELELALVLGSRVDG